MNNNGELREANSTGDGLKWEDSGTFLKRETIEFAAEIECGM